MDDQKTRIMKDKILRKIDKLVDQGFEVEGRSVWSKAAEMYVCEFKIDKIKSCRNSGLNIEKYFVSIQGKNLDNIDDNGDIFNKLNSICIDQKNTFEQRRDRFIESYLID